MCRFLKGSRYAKLASEKGPKRSYGFLIVCLAFFPSNFRKEKAEGIKNTMKVQIFKSVFWWFWGLTGRSVG